MTQTLLWTGFSVLIVVSLLVDLGVFHRKSHAVGVREALYWTAFWLGLGILFGGVLFFTGTDATPDGTQAGVEFLTGLLLEKALSVDNIFIFAMLFSYFRVPAAYQHKVLFWGILGALVMRGFFIWAGIGLIRHFHWTVYLFGGFLILTGIKMFVFTDTPADPERNLVLRVFRAVFPVTPEFRSDRFWVREGGRLMATPLCVVLVLVESTDLVFAVDSIPAIIAITTDPLIVFTSNVFAILGLRSLYFAVAGIMDRFHHLRQGLSTILVFVGIKMLIAEHFPLPPLVSPLIVLVILVTCIATSMAFPARPDPPEQGEGGRPT